MSERRPHWDDELESGAMDVTYWKATRPDGTDFHTGTVDYAAALASGVPVTAPASDDCGFPGPGWLHLATVPTECVGMSWPCRLFEVEPADDLGGDRPRHAHKVGATAVRVLREVDAHVALGPQGAQVAAFIERCATLTADDVRRLVAAWVAARDAVRDAVWDAVWDAAWDAAWVAARDAARDAAWVAARDAVRDAVWDAVWVTTRDAAWVAAWVAARDAVRDAVWDAVWDAAWGTARVAVWALLLRDLIGLYPGWDRGAYDLLTGPWRQVIGPLHPDDGDEGLGQ